MIHILSYRTKEKSMKPVCQMYGSFLHGHSGTGIRYGINHEWIFQMKSYPCKQGGENRGKGKTC